MKNATCPRVSFDFEQRFLPPVFVLVFVVGLVANALGLMSLLHNWKKLNIINIFVLNLGLADVQYLLTLPFLMVYYFNKSTWIFGDTFCKVTRFCFNLNLYGSIGFLTCISVYRYLAIVHPMRVMRRLRVSHSVIISVTVWLLVSVQSLPDMFYAKTYKNTTTRCFDTTYKKDIEDYLRYSLGWTFTGFIIPFLIILVCYGHVIVILCRKNATNSVQKQRCLRLLFILILLFSLCYIPYHVSRNLSLWSRVLLKRQKCYGWFNGVYVAKQISRGLVCLNSAFNPLVYLHGNEDIPAELRRLLQRLRQRFVRPPPTNSGNLNMRESNNDVEVKI